MRPICLKILSTSKYLISHKQQNKKSQFLKSNDQVSQKVSLFMRIQKNQIVPKYILDPGDYYVTNKKVIIKTLLGSCVAACLYDPVNHVMGMNHFLLSRGKAKQNGSIVNSESGRYGINAMELIINGMMKLGAVKKNIKAKAFGGGNVLGNQSLDSEMVFNIGNLNVQFIREFLETEKIPLVSSDLGGTCGRVVLFQGSDYTVLVRKIKKSDAPEIIERDKNYLNSTVQKKWQLTTEIDLWKKTYKV